ncbi:MAG: acyl-CoA dehydrogenase [Parvularculaceae bacterium]
MTYTTPIRDMHFALTHMAGFQRLVDSGAYEDLSDDLVMAVLEEVGKLADNVIAPLNQTSDNQGARLEDGNVITSPGFVQAYRQYVEGGWNALAFPSEYGGQGLPQTLALTVSDALFGACIGFSMGTCLTTGAVKALLAYGTDEQKQKYLAKMVSGEWTGTMNLTEPQAGSDLSNLRTKAEPTGDGQYKITGNKIFISYGDHDMAENICHLVLARLPDAPEGTRGVSMFLVPKFHVSADGSLGARNDAWVTGLEHKMGQHGSPTCSMAYGDKGECLGTLVGQENQGLRNMFVMMNAARIDVGMQAVSVGERSFQAALAFAQERKQGRAFGVKTGDPVSIIQHPDVRRNLYLQKSLTEASRAVCYANMVNYDLAHIGASEEIRQRSKEREELLTPISKSFASDRANESTSIGVQVFGGMGFVEEAGAAQHMRDVRICGVYEGTNGIQAIDLVGRKLGMGGGKLARDFLDDVQKNAAALHNTSDKRLQAMATGLKQGAETLAKTTGWMVDAMGSNDPNHGLAGATPYLDQFGYVAGAHYLAKGALAAAKAAEAAGDTGDFYQSKVALAGFYMDNILPRAEGLAPAVVAGADSVAPIDPALLTG